MRTLTGAEFASGGTPPLLKKREALRLMDTPLPSPALAAATPVAFDQPALIVETSPRRSERISDIVNSTLFFGLLAVGVLFPFAALIYALIAR